MGEVKGPLQTAVELGKGCPLYGRDRLLTFYSTNVGCSRSSVARSDIVRCWLGSKLPLSGVVSSPALMNPKKHTVAAAQSIVSSYLKPVAFH